jgi:hypothetical protein
MDNSYPLMDLTAYGRQEQAEDSPAGRPQQCTNTRTDGGAPDWPPASSRRLRTGGNRSARASGCSAQIG